MILSIADIHLGHKLYSSILDNGLTTAEEDTRAALDKVYERASALDIEMIICAGDFFHVSKPSSENIRWAITWVKKMDSLGKPVYIIPGNHDVSAYWNSLVFLKSLYVRNVVLVDQDILKIDWVRGPIYFVPFLSPESTKNKYATTLEALNSLSTIIDPTDKNIIVTHIQEAASKISSESTMISRGIETINMDYFSKVPCTDTILLSGHMHMHQIYTKNGITIVYPGSLTYTESTDCGQKKGYVLIDHDGTIKFEEIQGVRKYKQYILPKGKDPAEFFSSIRMAQNEVVFLKSQDDAIINDSAISNVLKNRNCKLAKVSYTFDKTESAETQVSDTDKDPFIILEKWISNDRKDVPDDIQPILSLGREFLNNEIEHD